jgi:hypothetical protein
MAYLTGAEPARAHLPAVHPPPARTGGEGAHSCSPVVSTLAFLGDRNMSMGTVMLLPFVGSAWPDFRRVWCGVVLCGYVNRRLWAQAAGISQPHLSPCPAFALHTGPAESTLG